MPSVSAMSSAVIGASERYSRPWIWLTERLTPHSSPISPQCRMNRSTAAGSFFLTVVSVITEISDKREQLSSHMQVVPRNEKAPHEAGLLHFWRSRYLPARAGAGAGLIEGRSAGRGIDQRVTGGVGS